MRQPTDKVLEPPPSLRAAYRSDCFDFALNSQAYLSDCIGISEDEASIIEPSCAGFDPSTALFLDTETTGLAQGVGTIAFLVGLGWLEEGCFRVEQHLMLDYPGEQDVLLAVHRRISEAQTVVTFNGKSFDIPLLTSRMILSRLRMPVRQHIDLLHPARRMWKLRLESCTLTRLEERLLGLVREDDLPGSEVPQRFFQYLKTGETALLEDIVLHNRQDIVSMAALMGLMTHSIRRPVAGDSRDVYSLGRVFERAGRTEEAIDCYCQAIRPQTAWLARRSLVRLYRRKRDHAKACALLVEEIEAGQGGIEPMIELARLCEWRTRDYRTALWAVETAEARFARLDRMLPGPQVQREELLRRKARLERKLSKAID